jgi:hypothetical protein
VLVWLVEEDQHSSITLRIIRSLSETVEDTSLGLYIPRERERERERALERLAALSKMLAITVKGTYITL